MKNLVLKIYQKLKRIFKIYILSKPRARGVIQVSIDNADMYFGNNEQIKIYKLVEYEDIEIKQPRFLNEDLIKALTPFNVHLKSVLLDINSFEFSFRNNHLITQELNIIYEPDIEFTSLPIAYEFLSECQMLKGTVAYLSNTSPNNYGHWFIYTLPMIRLYWKLISKEEIDYYYIGDFSKANFKLETLIALGIKEEQIVDFPCQADRLMTCVIDRGKQNGNYKYPDVFAYKFARNLFLPREINSNSKYPKRLYIPRGDVTYRQVVNEDKVLEYLDSLGFEALTMQNRTVKEQAAIFYNADVIIAPCGSALTNLLFVRENITVIEIFPFNYPDGFFFALANYAKANYFYVKGEEIPCSRTKPIYSDIKLNIEKLKQICKLAGVGN